MCKPLLGDRVETELATGEDEGAEPDPIWQARVRALEEERIRRQRSPAGEQLRSVAGELEGFAGTVLALADPEQLRRCVQNSEGLVGIDERPPGSRGDNRVALGCEVTRFGEPARRDEAEQLSARDAEDLEEPGWVMAQPVHVGEPL